MGRFNYKVALDNAVDDINKMLNTPMEGSDKATRKTNIGHIHWAYDGTQDGSFSLRRYANENGGINRLYTAGSKAELLCYAEGYLDGIRRVKSTVAGDNSYILS